MTLNELKDAVLLLDPKLKRRDDAFKVSVVLLASVENQLRTPHDLAVFTRYDETMIVLWLGNLAKSGLGWKRTRFHHSGWFHRKTGGIAFWLDVNVALGYMEKKGR